MNDLERIRSQAIGQETDKEFLKLYPIKAHQELHIETRHGMVTVHLYRPFADEVALPVLINFHGGGFVKGYRGRDTEFAHVMAVTGKCLVLDVDYKTAPEYCYPYALEEGYDLVKYFQEHIGEYGGDGNRLVLTGQSSGANILTGIILMLKKAGEKLPTQAICCYPPYDLWKDPMDKYGADQDPERSEAGRLYNDWYVEKSRRKEIYVSPVYAEKEDLQGLVPFTIIAAEKDPLCSEALEFACKLMEAGVTVTVKKVTGAKHGFIVRRATGHEIGKEVFFEALKRCF